MFFRDIVGQEAIIRNLTANVNANRISHAQLFLGSEGSGHLPLALAFATYIHCKNKTADDACGVCPSCLKMKKLEHPDLHFFFPVSTTQEHKKDPVSSLFYPQWRTRVLENPYFAYNEWLAAIGIENKQALINAGDCNEIIRVLGLKSFESPYKIVIIYMVEKLYHAAAPKLLKILEEPPENTLFLMVSENKDMILNTILSRTQILKVPRPDDQAIVQMLINRYRVDKESARHMADLAAGNICNALKLVGSDTDPYEHFEQFRSWMRLCFRKDIHNLLGWVEATSRFGREKLKSFLGYGLRVIRLCVVRNYGVADMLTLQQEEKRFIDGLSPFVHQANTLTMASLFEQAIFHVERNANPKILLADLSFQIAKLLKPFQS